MLGTWAGMVAGAGNPSVAEALAATSAPGSAQVTIFGRLHSTHPPERAVTTGTGVIDFTRPAWTVRDVVRSTALPPMGGTGYAPITSASEIIVVGSASYLRLATGPPGASAEAWIRQPGGGPDSVASPLDGVAGSALGLLAYQPGQLFLVRAATPATDGGTPYGVRPTTQLSACLAAHRRPGNSSQISTTVWLDGEGRIVRVRSTERDLIADQGAPFPAGSFVFESVVTMTLGQFGRPVHIEAPSAASVQRPAYPRLITLRAPC